MSYKTVLVHLDSILRAQDRIRFAADIAMANDAHLIAASMIGVSTLTFDNSGIDEKDPAIAAHLAFLQNRARKHADEFEAAAKKMGLSSYEARVVDGEPGYGICLQARYCDLVVIGQTNIDDPSPIVGTDFPESVLLNCGKPVLIVPYSKHLATVGKKSLIAWDASRAAVRAVTDAIPMLQKADVVQVAVFNPDSRSEAHGQNPGEDIALFLARHGINVEVLPPQKDKDVGKALLSLAGTLSSDLLVMGGYGHTRFREFLMGGVTRTVLDEAAIPVLVSH